MSHYRFALVAALAVVLATPAAAKDKVRFVDTQATIFDTFALYQAQAEGYFDAENVDPSIIIGQGGGGSLQIAITGSADIVVGTGILSVISAYSKGAPVVIIANGKRGASELFWYVKADSPIKSFKDLDGKDFTYSTPGSFTHLFAQTMARELGIKPKFVSATPMAAVRTQMMSGQLDTAWSGFPTNMDMIRSGEGRIIGRGDDSATLRTGSHRVIVANANWLAKNRDAAMRAMRAYWKGQQYNFSGDAAIKRYAEHWKLNYEEAKTVHQFYKLSDLSLAPISQLEQSLKFAEEYGFLKEPLSEDQKKGLVDIVYDPDRK